MVKISKIVGIVLVLVGVFLVVWNVYDSSNLGTEHRVDKAKSLVEETSAEDIRSNIEKTRVETKDGELKVTDEGYPESSEERITYDVSNIEYSTTPPTDNKNVSYIVGEIYIPDVNVKENIFEGISNDNLWVGVGTVKPNQVFGKGNYSIAGHHMENPSLLFSPIMNSKLGEVIYLSDKETVYEYEIDNVVTVDSSQGQYIQDRYGEGIVTLVTCTDPYGTDRRIVQGTLVAEYNIADANEDVQEAFK